MTDQQIVVQPPLKIKPKTRVQDTFGQLWTVVYTCKFPQTWGYFLSVEK